MNTHFINYDGEIEPVNAETEPYHRHEPSCQPKLEDVLWVIIKLQNKIKELEEKLK